MAIPLKVETHVHNVLDHVILPVDEQARQTEKTSKDNETKI